ncbi:hypothetical protein M8J75_000202 [Diaphorina citri]|nr:hypothetical protein M8J75_000202 [Diaphorina citri]
MFGTGTLILCIETNIPNLLFRYNMTDKDVHDGWCMYEERSAVAGSTSSDSESIEIISEDEAGNYQIYSKNYFRPDKTVTNADSTSCNKDTDNFSPIDTEIKEYSENDPDQLVVEEGKEAHEKSDGDSNEKSEKVDPICDSQRNKRKSKHKKANQKIPQDCEKQLTDSDVLLSDKSDTSSQEISCQLKEKESLGTVSPENIAKESFQTTNESNSSIDFSEIVADETSNELIESFVKEGDSSCENVDIDEIADNKANETEYTVSTDTQAEKDVQLDPEKFPSYQSKFTDHNELPINQKNSQTDDNGFECIRTQSSVNNEETAKAFSDNTFGKENIKDDVNSGADTLSTSSTDEIKACESTIKKPRKRHNIKKVRNENLSILESKNTHVNNIKDKKPKTSTANSLSTLDNKGSVSPQDPLQSPELTDISTLVLISIVGSVIYLIYSSLGYTNPASVLLPSEDKLDDNLGVHDRYIQLVEDWEARVLENAKLDYQIALKERSEKLLHAGNAARQNITTDTSLISLPDCLHPNILTHLFVYLRHYPPDIHDPNSWSLSKLCVDLSLLLAEMKISPFSAVLKFLLFLASPSSELNYQAVFEHYLNQQKIYIHDVIKRDYPEIYQSNNFYKPDGKLEPYMYCLSMQRFSILKNKYAPGEENMQALLRLSGLYVENEACLVAVMNGMQGTSVDKLFTMSMDVLVSRSITTAITLDPSLLHDYYLELTLSNEANLKKLSRQLFKYNILAIQKFNLTLGEEPLLIGHQRGKGRKRTITREEFGKKEVINEKEFLLVRDGDDEILVLNRRFVQDWNLEDPITIKQVTLRKEDVALFYDTQLREISNGYSSKVSKFLNDINKDLKHALCYPYVNEEAAPLHEKNESLVRFIRNMCRTNVEASKDKVGETVREKKTRQSSIPSEESVVFKTPSTPSNEEYVKIFEDSPKHEQVSESPAEDIPRYEEVRESPAETNTEDWTPSTQDRMYIMRRTLNDGSIRIPVPGEPNPERTYNEWNSIPAKPQPKVLTDPDSISHSQGVKPGQPKVLSDPDSRFHSQEIKAEQPKVLKDPDNIFLQGEKTEQSIHERLERDFKEPLNDMNGNIPDLWILNNIAYKFQAKPPEEMEKPRVNIYDILQEKLKQAETDELRGDKYNEDIEIEKAMHEDIDSWIEKSLEYNDDEIENRRDRINVYDTIRTDKSLYDAHDKMDREKHDRVNAYDSRPSKYNEYGERSKTKTLDKVYDSRPNAYDSRTNEYDSKVNAYDSKPKAYNSKSNAYDSRSNAYDSKPNAYNSKSNAYDTKPNAYNSRADKKSSRYEERIVHIDGHDNKYSRHVYIDDFDDQKRPPVRSPPMGTSPPTGERPPTGRNKRDRYEDADWWMSRRARLRAKLRKKHFYPVQDNPEYQES